MKVSSRARRHEDRGGDPLDGLVNLFDLGIVLSVAFLIAALSSLDLTGVLTDEGAAQASPAAADAVTAEPGETVQELQLDAGERVVGSGQEIGRVYQLDDGRTVIVRPEGSAPAPGEVGSAEPAAPDAEAEVPVTPPESEAPITPPAPVPPVDSGLPEPIPPPGD